MSESASAGEGSVADEEDSRGFRHGAAQFRLRGEREVRDVAVGVGDDVDAGECAE